jgi:hypothetical protein
MTVHSRHPDTHEHGLADGCDRCAEHALRPFDGLDARNLAALYRRVRDDEQARSLNEARAMDAIRLVANQARMLGMVDS